jgi:dTDP-4-amino-4,6-dideoxygalactose transaminase
MTGFVRSGSLGVAIAVLDDGSGACDPNDEVLVAAPTWAAAARLMRERGYRHVPRRADRMKPSPDAVALAVGTPGVVYRRTWATGEEWQALG